MFYKTNVSKQHDKGFALTELLVSAALFSVVVLGMSAIYIFAVDQFKTIQQKIKSEENHAWASYYIKTMLSQADALNVESNIDDSTLSGEAKYSNTVRKDYECTGCDKCPDDGIGSCLHNDKPDVLALFSREVGYPNYQNVIEHKNKYRPSGIFFEKPKLTSPGTLHLVYGGTNTNTKTSEDRTIYNINYRREDNDDTAKEFEFDQSVEIGDVVGISFKTEKKDNNKRAVSTYVTLQIRYYSDDANDINLRRFCSLKASTDTSDPKYNDCKSENNFWDIQDNVVVNYRNNDVSNLVDKADINLYFYKMIKPLRGF